MSVKILTKAWDCECPTLASKLVLIALSDNSNDQHVCWPSMETIAKNCSMSRRSVVDQIEKLTALGMIEVDRDHGKSNRYFVLRNHPSSASGSHPPVNGVHTTCESIAHPPVNGVHTGVQALHTNRKEPSFEPSTVPSSLRSEAPGVTAENEKEPEASKEPDPSDNGFHQKLVEEFTKAYETKFGVKYTFSGGKDGSAVKRLRQSGFTVDRLITGVKRAWEHPDLFACRQAVTISGFQSRINEIWAELVNIDKGGPPARGASLWTIQQLLKTLEDKKARFRDQYGSRQQMPDATRTEYDATVAKMKELSIEVERMAMKSGGSK